MDTPTADELIERLALEPHPEGGWYAETWRAPARSSAGATSTGANPDTGAASGRAASSGIYFLLRAGERSHWHRVDADEIWLFHAGDPLRLSISPDDGTAPDRRVLGADLAAGQEPQLVVPEGWWQAAEPLGAWTLVSCVVAPGFTFDGFELAEPGWAPG